jgi:Ca2+-binding EF-hand superfamily protein
VFMELDRDKSNQVDYEEFLEAALNRKEIMNASNVELLFNSIVREGRDYITKADL